jgi:hypothetical protein
MSQKGLHIKFKGQRWLTVRFAGHDKKPGVLWAQNCHSCAIHMQTAVLNFSSVVYLSLFVTTFHCQYSKTDVMYFSFNLLSIKGLYMFRALLVHLQEALHKRHLLYCVQVTPVGWTRIGVEGVSLKSWCSQTDCRWLHRNKPKHVAVKYYIKVKVYSTTGHEAHRGSRGIALIFLRPRR